jgi:hypothetical protein
MKKLLLILCLLLTACIEVQVHEKLHRDGSVSAQLSFVSNSSQTRNGFRGMQFAPGVVGNITEDEKAITYHILDITKGPVFNVNNQDIPFFANTYVNKESGWLYTTYTVSFSPSLSMGDPMIGQFASQIPVTYTVEGFGSISETNGEQLNDITAKFTIDPTVDKNYTVSFKELRIINWLKS